MSETPEALTARVNEMYETLAEVDRTLGLPVRQPEKRGTSAHATPHMPEWRDVSELRAYLMSSNLNVDYHGGEIVQELDKAPAVEVRTGAELAGYPPGSAVVIVKDSMLNGPSAPGALVKTQWGWRGSADDEPSVQLATGARFRVLYVPEATP